MLLRCVVVCCWLLTLFVVRCCSWFVGGWCFVVQCVSCVDVCWLFNVVVCCLLVVGWRILVGVVWCCC